MKKDKHLVKVVATWVIYNSKEEKKLSFFKETFMSLVSSGYVWYPQFLIRFNLLHDYYILIKISINSKFISFVCFYLGLQISKPVIKYWPDPSCMSHMEARAEIP